MSCSRASCASCGIQIKLLSGEMIPLEVSVEETFNGLYRKVYDVLPEDVRPYEEWQLTLMRQTSDGEYEEISSTKERVNAQEGELFFAVIETRYVMANCNHGRDAYNTDVVAVNHDDYLYSISTIGILLEENGMAKDIWKEDFLYHAHTDHYFRMKGVDGQWVGRFRDEFSFHFTGGAETRGYNTFEEMLDEWLLELDGYSNRTKEHLKRGWMIMFGKYNQEEEWTEPETTEEWDQAEEQWEDWKDQMRSG